MMSWSTSAVRTRIWRTITVSLRGAISYANSQAGTDLYHIDIPNGSYTLNIGSSTSEDANQEGDLDVTASLVLLHGESKLFTIINGNATDRVIDIQPDTNLLTIYTLTIRNGSLETGEGGGGGIRVASGNRLIIDYVIVEDNIVTGADGSLDNGGGIYTGSLNTITINHSIIQGNSACTSGGIATVENTLMILNSDLENNTASCEYSLGGGVGISAGGTTYISNSSFIGNDAYRGGGLFNSSDANLSIFNSTFSNNESIDDGGGLNLFGTSTLTNVTLDNNIAGAWGGAIYADDSVDLKNVTIAGNEASKGGGIALPEATSILSMDHVSFAANTASSYGSVIYVNTNASVTVTNSILASPFIPDIYNCYIDLSASWITNGYNISNDGSCLLSGSGDWSNTNPMLDTLGNYGGPTRTLQLQEESPAIDRANPSGCSPRDQRGYYRPVDGDAVPGAICDIGAFEHDSFPLNNLSWLPLIKE